MRNYDEAMESLRLSDPIFHQKLTNTLKQISELPEETVQQLSDTLEDITDTDTYRDKLTTYFDTVKKVAEESFIAFEDETSWLMQQLSDAQIRIISTVRGAGVVASRTVDTISSFLHTCLQTISMSEFDCAQLRTNAVGPCFLFICFISSVYFFYNKDMTEGHHLFTKIAILIIFASSICIALVGIDEHTIRCIFPAVTLGALIGKMPSFLPPSRVWPNRKQRSEGPQTWSATLGCMIGFLLSSGFLAWVALVREDGMRDPVV